jgi:hypothetical protein
MALIPETASDSLIAKLSEISRQHCEDLKNDPSLAAKLDSDPSAMLAQADKLVNKVMLRHRGLPLVRAQIDPTIPDAKFARALASEGLCVKNNAETRDLYVTYLPEICEHGIDVDARACDDCNEERGATIQAKSVGK